MSVTSSDTGSSLQHSRGSSGTSEFCVGFEGSYGLLDGCLVFMRNRTAPTNSRITTMHPNSRHVQQQEQQPPFELPRLRFPCFTSRGFRRGQSIHYGNDTLPLLIVILLFSKHPLPFSSFSSFGKSIPSLHSQSPTLQHHITVLALHTPQRSRSKLHLLQF